MIDLEKLLAETTPGPWDGVNVHTENACVTITADYHSIATLYGGMEGTQDEDGHWSEQPTRDANARLIAMAPTLARKVIAAEKLAHLARLVEGSFGGGLTMTFTEQDVTEFATAIAAWEAAQ